MSGQVQRAAAKMLEQLEAGDEATLYFSDLHTESHLAAVEHAVLLEAGRRGLSIATHRVQEAGTGQRGLTAKQVSPGEH